MIVRIVVRTSTIRKGHVIQKTVDSEAELKAMKKLEQEVSSVSYSPVSFVRFTTSAKTVGPTELCVTLLQNFWYSCINQKIANIKEEKELNFKNETFYCEIGLLNR